MWNRPADLLITDLDDELILMDPDSAEMYSLNGSARLLWQALPASEATLTDLLQRTYGLGAQQAHADLHAWLSDMGRRGLVQPA
ncbi:PqqD family protein [Deinococcus soli (ex Cha et al. 2016)]|jgi:hypothetical protein|uniref:PqqD family protein n=1 Tax=Deinococcus soli (ex Cha et al. 2016) TaxID=1309411 RepID=A0A0F7JNK7_9DEIO|nr:PqqD family protein [Deinococcus soli (ex Cha et al. 2016)]AKH16428.1 hypothetical protein SY84_04480 [Deinococcus soli (ex Cha et al. 2016)]GGB50644.1 hypothetical protein GCM10008019_02870 [Deinococcus soli (ex Cha et al. 2016)]